MANRVPAPPPRIVAISPDDGTAIDLRNPALAAFLSWLVPGLGQLYQGRTFKGVIFMATILGTFLAGMWIGGGKVVYASWRPGDKRWAFIAQAGVGAAAIPAFIQATRVSGSARQPLGAAGWFAPPLLQGQVISDTYRKQLIALDPDIGPEHFEGTRFMPGRATPTKKQTWNQLSLWHRRLGRFFDIGTLYTMLAGMLNLLVIYDAWAGPMRQEPPEPDGDESPGGG